MLTFEEFRDTLIKLVKIAKQAGLNKAAMVEELEKHSLDLYDEIESDERK